MKKSISILSILLLAVLLGGAGCVSFSSKKSTTSGPAGVFVSQDKGDSWKQISSLPQPDGVKSISGVSVYRLVEDPQDAKAMYLGSRKRGLFYTFNNGTTWQQSTGPFSSGFVYDIAIHPKNKCIIYASSGQRVYKTDDCMRNWTEMYRESRSNVSIRSLAFSQFAPYQVYLAESNGDILRSFDSGHSWSVLRRFNTRVLRIIPSPLKQGLVYMITQKDGLYRSLDGGESWKSLKKGLSTYSGGTQFRKHLLHAVNPETIYWVSKYGILRSDDMGDSWTPMKLITAPGGANIYGFAVNPQNDNEIYYTATIGTRSTFYKTADGGQNWVTKKLPSGQVPTVLRVHPSNPNMLYLGLTIPPSK